MSQNETKKIIISAITLALISFIPKVGLATNDYSSANFTVKAPVIDTGFSSASSLNFGLGQSLSQTAIGKSSSASFELWSGFQYFFKVNSNTLSATAGDQSVALSWTVPQAYLGVSAGKYQVGTGVVSGSYVFEDVGNVTSFTKSGLTNGTPYFFIVKAETASGGFLVFSNEATATPIATVVPPGGGGGGGAATGISISGQAYPNASINLVRDSINIGTSIADGSGHFLISNNNLTAGDYNFLLYAVDSSGVKSASLSFSATIASGVVASKTGLVLAPTLQSDLGIVKQGDSLVLSGYSAPNSKVNLSIASQLFQQNPQVTSDAGGKYAYTLNTANLSKGEYTASAVYTFNNQSSPTSLPVKFTIGERTIPPPAGGCSNRSDLNCDGRVNLVDFSILLFYWDKTEFSANPRVDINRSGRVDLGDFSIMLYDWTG